MDENYWETTEKTLLVISEMHTIHILNCLQILKMKRPWREEYKEIFLKELKKRSELAYELFAESEGDEGDRTKGK